MNPSYSSPGKSRRQAIPPVILHPFGDRSGTDRIAAALGADRADGAYLESRYAELRMLCFIGKDLNRWLEQCVELANADPELHGTGLSEASFINLLLFDAPASVVKKLESWEVGNYQLIFSRALGLNAVFPHPPGAGQVSEALLRGFHHYADALFDARLKFLPGAEIEGAGFHFELYASGEYAQLLEEAWSEPSR